MQRVHQRIVDYDATSYEDSLIPVHKLHMTLACLGLDHQEDIEKASEFLENIKSDLEKFTPKDTSLVELSGVNHFFHNVLYAQVQENKNMLNFVNHLRDAVTKAGIEIRDVFDFNPHVTILKFKRHHQAMANTRYIDPRLYEMFEDTRFGAQIFDNIYLCKMTTEEDAETGFYICPKDIQLEN